MLTLLVELSVYCICGQLILNKVSAADSLMLNCTWTYASPFIQGEIVAAAIYGSEWYKITNARQRRYIQLFILGAQKPNGLSAWNIFQLSFSSLTSVSFNQATPFSIVLATSFSRRRSTHERRSFSPDLTNRFLTDIEISGQLHRVPSECYGLRDRWTVWKSGCGFLVVAHS